MMNREIVNFFLEHLEVERRLSQHTVISYSTDLEQFIEFLSSFLPPKSVLELTHKDIRLWIIELSNSSIGNRSINRKIATLRTFYKYLLRSGKISDNPMSPIKMVKTQKKLPQFLRESEIESIQTDVELSSFEDHRNYLIFLLLYGTGIRLAELISLKRSSLNFSNHTLRVLGKRNKERIIPIPSILTEVILKYIEICPFDNENLLLTDKGEALYPMFVQRLIKSKLSEVSTLEKLSPHILRHTYATHLLNQGADLNAIKELLGHANLAATQVYTHNSMEKMKEIYQQAHPKA
jgi:integrase/recombinase XerC